MCWRNSSTCGWALHVQGVRRAGLGNMFFFSFGETALTAHRLTPDSAQSQISNTTDSLLIELWWINWRVQSNINLDLTTMTMTFYNFTTWCLVLVLEKQHVCSICSVLASQPCLRMWRREEMSSIQSRANVQSKQLIQTAVQHPVISYYSGIRPGSTDGESKIRRVDYGWMTNISLQQVLLIEYWPFEQTGTLMYEQHRFPKANQSTLDNKGQ